MSSLVLLLLGIGLAANCAYGLFSKEGMYSSESTNIMFWSQLGGIALGIGMACWSLGLLPGTGNAAGICLTG